ncbi:MAG: DUF885 family protein, partial [Acidimicrobiales bacterium]
MPQDQSTPRQIADRYVEAVADLDPLVATALGIRPHDDRMPDLSPEGTAERDDLARATLGELEVAVGAEALDEGERRCAKVLRERLESGLLISEACEHERDVNILFSPVQRVRQVFLLMPTATSDDWEVVARRMMRVADAYESYRRSLEAGAAQGIFAAPRQVETVVAQLDVWLDGQDGSWFAGYVSRGPDELRSELEDAAEDA